MGLSHLCLRRVSDIFPPAVADSAHTQIFIRPEPARKQMATAASLRPLFLPCILSHNRTNTHPLFFLPAPTGTRVSVDRGMLRSSNTLSMDFPAPGLSLCLFIQRKMMTLQGVQPAQAGSWAAFKDFLLLRPASNGPTSAPSPSWESRQGPHPSPLSRQAFLSGSLRGSGGWSSVCPLFSSPFFSIPHFPSLIFPRLGVMKIRVKLTGNLTGLLHDVALSRWLKAPI